ncbi:MAG: tetratricopeptide repeat protein [Candidatus Aminicenantes bacterium]|nr:tetratricopeptide repeat protein [Candidatus Aminicenantes bacterium]MDH5383406.1 tetratricopeptide repeat protein [Candidatus Aminicenantes bacterium]MDH5743205.1 tetratricopeptide repeat protein [Candidatus Aminicenantes bacterium]
MKKLSILIAILTLLAFSFGSLALQNGYDLFQKALAKERAEGNLEEAIALYQKVIAESKDESLAAKAQFRIGVCYEKLGLKKAKLAQDAFQKVISDYPGQRDIVKMAQEKLSSLIQAESFVEQGDGGKNLRLVMKGSAVDALEMMGAPSPDGRYVTFTDWDTGNLAVYEISTKKKWPLTGKKNWEDNSWCENSRWSPDGKKIAYSWWIDDEKNDLRIIGLDGSEPRILTGPYGWIICSDWSPDGRHILAAIYGKANVSGISLVSVADGSIKTLKKMIRGDSTMRFSPDGKYIAFNFLSKEGSDSDIYLLSIDGKTEFPLVEHPAHDYLLGWTPDGKYLLFASDRTGTFDAWILPVSDGRPNGEPEIVRKNLGYVDPMGVTLNGDFYYGFSSNIQNIYIAAVNPETCLSDAPVKKMSLPFEGRNHRPEFSPDGKQIAFVRSSLPPPPGGLEGPNFLCVRSLEEGREKVFPLNRKVYDLDWAPDSLSILVLGTDREGRHGFYRVDVNTGEVSVVIQDDNPARSHGNSPEWSDDGKALLYLNYDRINFVCPIVYQNLETGQTKTIHQLDIKKSPLFTISPDKRWLAIIDQPIQPPAETYERVVKIIPAEGGEPRELCRYENSRNARVIPRWSADGRFIIYSRIQKGEKYWELWRVPFNGGQPQKMGISMTGPSTISPHPDGRQIAFTSHDLDKKAPEIWVMENFLPKAIENK